ncbi:hypothetical protein AFLA70_41g004500 [Aspergillus flavus AF70]|nr:hypothetical protein AFLA70_41g004500 [Aspergillus flavus AF70]
MTPYIGDTADPSSEPVKHGDWRDEFDAKGYVVLKNVVPKERALYYRQKMLDWLGSFDNGFNINDRSTWTEENLPWSFKNGMYLNYCAAHEKYVWDAKQEPGVLDAFAKIWGTDELIASYDTVNITLPNAAEMGGTKPWPHVDQAPERNGMHCVQGFINMSEAGPKDGGLVVMEGSAPLFEKFFKEFPPDRTKGPLAALHYDFYPFQDEDLKWYEARGCKIVKVCAEPGDLVLWDSRQMHYAVYPETDLIRTVIYTCYTPAAWISPEDLENKKEIFHKWEATTHWPHINIHSHGKHMIDEGYYIRGYRVIRKYDCKMNGSLYFLRSGLTLTGSPRPPIGHHTGIIIGLGYPKYSKSTRPAMEAKSTSEVQIEDVETFNNKVYNQVVGSTKLINDSEVVLVPTPSNDPNGKGFDYPLNLPVWQKYVILFIVGAFAATGNLMTSGLSAFLPAVRASYNGDPKTNDLITWPAFFMGIGNLIEIPLSYAIGRRPIYLFSSILLAFGCLWCAKSESLESHIAGRDLMSIAAGTCEALCPIIVKEIFFLHERGKAIAAFSALQTVGTAALIIASPYIASDSHLGWRWWYGIFGCVSGAVALLSIIFVKETKYTRSMEALNGEGIELEGVLVPVTTHMAPWSGNAEWSLTIDCCKQMCQVVLFPNVVWLILLNSAGLGIYVLMSALFAEVLVKPPFLWGFNTLGYVFTGQIVTAVAVPIVCGYFSDQITKLLSKRNNGISEPEYRLLAVILPTVAILLSTIIYGKTAGHPKNWTWAGIAVTLNFEYFGFVGIVVSSFVYCMDAYPQRVDATLVLICSCRGFIGFGISYGAIAFVHKTGYEGAFNICAGIMAALMVIGIFIYIFGRQIRRRTQKFAGGT